MIEAIIKFFKFIEEFDLDVIVLFVVIAVMWPFVYSWIFR